MALATLTRLFSGPTEQAGLVIDSGQYPTEAAARAAWQPMAGTAPVSTLSVDGKSVLRFPCNFAGTEIERASWDRQVRLDLTGCRGVQFDFFCPDASPVAHFSLYFQSRGGWYATTFYPESTGWNRITIDKSSMTPEGNPAGWQLIQTIRISAWRGGDTATEFQLRDFRRFGLLGADTHVALVRCDSAAEERSSSVQGAFRYSATVAKHFEELGIGGATLSDVGLTLETLRHAKLVVLPHNPVMPEETAEVLRQYLIGGGRLLAFYGMPNQLRPAVKIDAGPFIRPTQAGGFAVMRFLDGELSGAPTRVAQNSWNIREPKPVVGASRVVAEWLDPKGQPTGHAAVVASSNAVEMSHVLLDDDIANKRRMLLAMAGYLVPQLWEQTADAAIARVGQLTGFRDFDEATRRITAQGGDNPRATFPLEAARRLRAEAQALRAERRFAEACDRASEAAEHLLTAFAAAQQPLAGEFRAFWCHSAFGVKGMSWEEAIHRLADNGFTAILPNLLWGGVAYYPSQVLPVAPEVARQGDQLAQCLDACRKHGLQIHVWKVNWNLGSAPKDFVDRLRRENRLQADARGQEEPWLCPSHPENQKLEVDSLLEIVRRYPVDGIHFDYIRYPGGDYCLCSGCRERFARALGSPVQRWPQDVLKDGAQRQAWLEWRRTNITSVVEAVSKQARAVQPKIRISAAVFRNWPMDRDHVAQDWKLWCDRGYLDFVCPMDYTASNAQFENWVRKQKTWTGQTPCYPGIGAWELTPDRVIGQIQLTRQLQTKGFVLFNYDKQAARNLVPLLGRGITRKTN